MFGKGSFKCLVKVVFRVKGHRACIEGNQAVDRGGCFWPKETKKRPISIEQKVYVDSR